MSMQKNMFIYLVGLKSCSRKYEMSVDTMMDRDVANPLRMLSAYLITTAITSPPKACRQRKQYLKAPCEYSCNVDIPLQKHEHKAVHKTHNITDAAVNKLS